MLNDQVVVSALLHELLQEYDLVSYQEIDERVIEKRNKLKKWSNLLNG